MNATNIAMDKQFDEHRIAKVEAGEKGWTLTFDEGFCFWCPDNGIEPRVGDFAKCYGKGFGYSVRGLTINDAVVFYRIEAQEEAHRKMEQMERDQKDRERFELNRADHDRRIAALSRPLRERLERYQAANPDFRWKYESYELFVCEQAEAIAKHVKPGDIQTFKELGWSQQVAVVPELSDGHSGNTFGAACALAARIHAGEGSVKAMPAAIAPLVGQRGECVGA